MARKILFNGAIVLLFLFGAPVKSRSRQPGTPPPAGAPAMQSSEKDSRTPAQRKINSQILYEIYRRRGLAKQKNVPPGNTGIKIDGKGRALVDIRCEVSPALEKKIGSLDGTIVSTSRQYRSVVAWIPLLKLEQLAEDAAIRAIEPPAEGSTR